MKKSFLVGVVAVVAAMLIAGPQMATGTHSPANKVVASGSEVEEIAPQTNKTILTSTLKTSSPTDLLIEVNLECSILTSLVTNADNPTSTASGNVDVWIEFDGVPVPVTTIGLGEGQSSDGKVTFCNRTYSRTVTDQEDDDGQDEESDYIRTKSAHSFSWVKLNTGSGIHTIEVVADLTTAATDSATAEAIVGNRTLVVEPTKLANDATV